MIFSTNSLVYWYNDRYSAQNSKTVSDNSYSGWNFTYNYFFFYLWQKILFCKRKMSGDCSSQGKDRLKLDFLLNWSYSKNWKFHENLFRKIDTVVIGRGYNRLYPVIFLNCRVTKKLFLNHNSGVAYTGTIERPTLMSGELHLHSNTLQSVQRQAIYLVYHINTPVSSPCR